ncbi:MAG: hypothetical protein ACREVV_01605 [Steroidobacteraceae bacterium]
MNELDRSFLLIDCGRASRRTRGLQFAALTEGGSPPFIHWFR